LRRLYQRRTDLHESLRDEYQTRLREPKAESPKRGGAH
jgi:hypothetical protein